MTQPEPSSPTAGTVDKKPLPHPPTAATSPPTTTHTTAEIRRRLSVLFFDEQPEAPEPATETAPEREVAMTPAATPLPPTNATTDIRRRLSIMFFEQPDAPQLATEMAPERETPINPPATPPPTPTPTTKTPTSDIRRRLSAMFFEQPDASQPVTKLTTDEEDTSNTMNDTSTSALRDKKKTPLPPSDDATSGSILNDSTTRNASSISSSLSSPQTPPSPQLDEILSRIDEKLIPCDPILLRQTPIFKGALSLLYYQRDNYLVGTEYADKRQADRTMQPPMTNPKHTHFTVKPFSFPSFAASSSPSPVSVTAAANVVYDIPYDPTALGHDQMAALAHSFIPTETVRTALTPVVTDLFAVPLYTKSSNHNKHVGDGGGDVGALYHPIRTALTEVIQGQQDNLQSTIKSQLLQFLDNPHNREAMKSSTQGLLIQTTEQQQQQQQQTSISTPGKMEKEVGARGATASTNNNAAEND